MFPAKPVFVSPSQRVHAHVARIRGTYTDGAIKEDHALVQARSNGAEGKARDRRGRTHDTCTLCRGQPQTRPRILIVARISDASDGCNVADTIYGERTIQGEGIGDLDARLVKRDYKFRNSPISSPPPIRE